MRLTAAALIVFFVCVLAPGAWAGNEGGSGYGLPFEAGALLDTTSGVNPLATVTMVELTGADLVARGAHTAADALRLAANCYVYNSDRWIDRGETVMRVRGSAPPGIKVFLDGVPMEHGVFGTVDLDNLPADQLERIRVYPSPAPVIFGAEGGAVVEIVTRQAGEKFTTRFDARFGDRRRQLFSAGLGDTADWFQYFADANHDGAMGFPLPRNFEHTHNEDGGLREGSAYDRNHYRARAGVLYGEQGETHITFFYDKTERDVPSNLVLINPGYRRFPEQERLGGVANLQLGAFGPFHLKGEGYITEFSEKEDLYSDPAFENFVNQRDYRDVRAGGGLSPMLDFGRWSRIVARADIRNDEIEYFIQGSPRLKFYTRQFEAALADDVQPVTWLLLNVGGGYSQLEPTRSDTKPPGDTVSGWRARGGLAVGPFYGLSVRGTAGRNLRFPTVEEWFDADLGNPELEPETTDSAEAGINYAPAAGVQFDVVGFMRRTRDGIRAIGGGDTGEPLMFANDTDMLFRGLTVSMGVAPVAGLFLEGSYTYLQVRDEKNEMPIIRWPYTAAHSAAGEIRYRFDFGLGAAVNSEFAGNRVDYQNGEYLELPWYWLLGARIFYTYRDQVEVYVEGTNLTDIYYETHRYYSEPGRMVEGGIKLTY